MFLFYFILYSTSTLFLGILHYFRKFLEIQKLNYHTSESRQIKHRFPSFFPITSSEKSYFWYSVEFNQVEIVVYITESHRFVTLCE